jgi:hypothetical protein
VGVASFALPPPDPHESPIGEPQVRISSPLVVFAGGVPSRTDERRADAILDARPGILIVGVPRR